MSPGRVDTSARVRVVVADDSAYYRARIARLFKRLEGFDVVGMAADGEEAIRLIASERPDVAVLDLQMPKMDGFSVLRWAMASAPLPIVVCSSLSDRESVFRALDLGAVDFIAKPGPGAEALAVSEQQIVQSVRAASQARMEIIQKAAAGRAKAKPVEARPAVGVIAIAASTGGPAALQRIAHGLPRDIDVPIVVAQHMPAGFTRLFADRLARQGHFGAVEASDGELLQAGTIHIAPGGMQTSVRRGPEGACFTVRPREAGDVYAPSADVLLVSAAEVFGAAVVGVILTGMGDDGSRGAVDIRRRGGYVLAESSDTALIYGMPRAATATGGTDIELPLSAIPEALAALVRGTRGR